MDDTQDGMTEPTTEPRPADEGWEDIGSDLPPIHDWDAEPILTGTYQGSRRVGTEYGETTIHEFTRADDNEDAAAWGTVILDRKLRKVRVGQTVRVEYVGKEGRARMFNVAVRRASS